MYAISLSKEAEQILSKLDNQAEERVRKEIKKLRRNPYYFGKSLKGTKFWSLRVGDYGVLYLIDKSKNEVIIATLGHRRKIYKK